MSEQDPVTPAETSADTVTSGNVLEWTVHPMTRNIWVTTGVLALIAVIVTIVRFATDSMIFTLLAAIVLYASLAKFFFPTHYRMDDTGVTVKTLTQTLVKEWKLYRSYYPDKNGVLLSTFAEPSRLENFRGLYVLFWNNRDTVVTFIAGRLPAHEAGRKI